MQGGSVGTDGLADTKQDRVVGLPAVLRMLVMR